MSIIEEFFDNLRKQNEAIRKTGLPLILFGAFGLYLAWCWFNPKKEDPGCEIYHKTYIKGLRYKALKKYVDTGNHGNRTVEYVANGDERYYMVFDDQLNLMFYNLQVGDSVIKKKNSMYFDLKSKTTMKDSMYEFYVSCKDTIKTQKPQADDSNNN